MRHRGPRRITEFCILALCATLCLSVQPCVISGCGRSDTHPSASKAEEGKLIFNSTGCTQCHSVSGDKSLYGPPLNSIYKQQVVVFRGDEKISLVIDRKYIIRSMKDPEFEKLSGYENKKMPPVNIKPEEMEKIADYLIHISGDQQQKNP